jgi:arabinoxylan arabinofuranohydrolase
VGDQPPINDNNNHAAEFEFKGRWYHVYHNRVVAKKAGIPTGFRRNLALETFDYAPDGSIRKVEYTADSVAQVGHLDPYVRVEGETFSAEHGVETEPCDKGGMSVAKVKQGDWLRVSGVDFGSKGATRFLAEVASGTQGGTIELRLGDPEGRVIGRCAVGGTGGWQAWQTVTCPLETTVGVQQLFLRFVGGEGQLLSLNYWRME